MMMGRGLLARSMMGQAGKPGPTPGMTPGYGGPMRQSPQMQSMGHGMPGAFSGNPQFMAQLQQMMQMQPFAPPPRVGMPPTPGAQVGQTQGGAAGPLGFGGAGGADPMAAFRGQDMLGGAAPGMVSALSFRS
jgi:hypothetical protein